MNMQQFFCLLKDRELHQANREIMKRTIEKKHREILRKSDKLDLGSYLKHKELENKLKRAGIEKPKKGPKISDPAHTRSEIYR